MASQPRVTQTRGSYAKTEQFRHDVLDAALRIVAEAGFDATTLQDVAEGVGRSKAGVLHHFGSLDNLMLEIVKHRDEVNRRTFPTKDGAEFETLLTLVAHNATVPGLIGLFSVVSALAATDASQSRRRIYFSELYTRNRQVWAQRIERAQAAGAIRADLDPHTVAVVILATLDGLQVQWLLDNDIDMLESLRTLIRMLSPTP
ncbi:MAG: TetR/AcrR family transcriptional regulator [Microbacterium sp.]